MADTARTMRRMSMMTNDMTNKPDVIKNAINPAALSGEAYFQTLTGEAMRCGYLTGSGLERLRNGLMSCLGERIAYYTKEQSSSVRSEAAGQLMDGIMYTIGAELKSQPVEIAAEMLEKTSASELYSKGKRRLRVKFNAALHIYSVVQKTMLRTDCRVYNDTINDGIRGFFEKYSMELEPQETLITADYPTSHAVTDLCGVEFIFKYLENIYYENQFLALFPRDNIESLLYRLNQRYKDCIFNIFDEVYIMARRCIAAGAELTELGYEGEEADLPTPPPIGIGPMRVISELKITNAALAEYIKTADPKMSAAYMRY